MSDQSKGSCLCGKTTFQIEGEFESFFLCHCKYCQKDTGSVHASNLFSTKAKLKWLSGEDLVKTYNLPSTRHVKSFCSECGSALPNIQMDGKLLLVPAGSLDSEVTIKPNAKIFMSSQSTWSQSLDETPEFKKLPTQES